MARSTGTYFTGTVTGVNNVDSIFTELETRIKAFQSNGGDAWEEYDIVSAPAASRDIVFRSLGDRTLLAGVGDAHLLMRMTRVNATTFRIRGIQDWSTTGNAGTNESGSTSAINGAWTAMSATQDMEFWGISNEYEFAMVMVQGGTYRWLGFGSPKRTHVPNAASGIARTSNAETAGSSVVIEVDRDITANIVVGQKIWLQNVTPSGTAIRSATINIATVTAKAAGSITVGTLANNFDAGAIIGQDPTPMYIGTSTTAMADVFFTNHANGSYEGAVSNGAEIEPLLRNATESVNDPNPSSLYMGCEAYLDDTDPADGGLRGTPQFLSFWTIGTQADQDRMIPNYDTALAHKVFPSVALNGLAVGLGPGATA